MQKRCFYCPELSLSPVSLSEEESSHILRVLRFQAGAVLLLTDGRGTLAEAELLPSSQGTKSRIAVCKILKKNFTARRTAGRVHLFVAPPKGKKFDLILKFATELGVSSITPIYCEYGVVDSSGKKDNFEQAVKTAGKQCYNPWFPKVTQTLKLGDALKAPSTPLDGCFGGTPSHLMAPVKKRECCCVPADYAVWIGPEGGFSPEEENLLLEKGYSPVTIGRYTLRVETAVPAILGYLEAKWKEMI
ncbi:MAG: RsmE family RNA methyltransferase [Lentisphaeria bacterium]